MPVVTVRIDEATHDAMQRHREINWSKVIRDRIGEVLDGRSRRNKLKGLMIAERLSRKPPAGYDSTKTIRHWRDRDRRDVFTTSSRP